ncbi:MAG: preprotein translocase subunit SecG [Pseudomonadota bacterium]
MITVILVAHTLIVLGLIVVVLLQRSDGGALGLGGGGGAGGFMSGRGAANALTRTTTIFAALFIGTSLSLAILAGGGEADETIIEELTGEAAPTPSDPGTLSAEDLIGTLGGGDSDAANEDATTEDVLEGLGVDPGPSDSATNAEDDAASGDANAASEDDDEASSGDEPQQ